MKIEVKALGQGAQEFMDAVRATLAEGYQVTTLSEQRVGAIAVMEAEVEPQQNVYPSTPRLSPDGKTCICDQCGREWELGVSSPECPECSAAWAEIDRRRMI